MTAQPARSFYAVREYDTGYLLCCGDAAFCAETLGMERDSFFNKAERTDSRRCLSLVIERYPGLVYEVKRAGKLVAKVESLSAAAEIMGTSYRAANYACAEATTTKTGYRVRRVELPNVAAPDCAERYAAVMARRRKRSGAIARAKKAAGKAA